VGGNSRVDLVGRIAVLEEEEEDGLISKRVAE
jgi:hypothetical protein